MVSYVVEQIYLYRISQNYIYIRINPKGVPVFSIANSLASVSLCVAGARGSFLFKMVMQMVEDSNYDQWETVSNFASAFSQCFFLSVSKDSGVGPSEEYD